MFFHSKYGRKRCAASCSVDLSPITFSNCFGELRRESGHNRVPTPPAKIIAFIDVFLYSISSKTLSMLYVCCFETDAWKSALHCDDRLQDHSCGPLIVPLPGSNVVHPVDCRIPRFFPQRRSPSRLLSRTQLP